MSEKDGQLQFMKELEEDWSPQQASPNMSTKGSRSVSPVEIRFMDLEASGRSHKLGKRRRSDRRATKLEYEARRSRCVSRTSLLPEARKFLDSASISQKLDWIGLQMRVPEYLENMRGVSCEATRNAATSSFIQHGRRSSLVMKNFDGAPNADGALERQTSKSMLSSEKRLSLSLMAFPANAKEWLLQSLRLQDSELQKLFDKMDSVPQLETYHLKELRAEWETLDMRDVNLPPEVEMLMKDQAMLERLKNLLTRFIEIEEANQYKAYEESLKKSEATTSDTESELPSEVPEDTHGSPTSPSCSSLYFEAGENMLPLYGKGVSLCSLCSQLKPRKMPRDSLYLSRSPSPSPQTQSPLPSFIPIEDYVIHHSIVQPGKREDVQLLEEWLKHVTQRTKCEDNDGHIADMDCSFILHSIAFLEVVRQVHLECEERGDMLLHVWRQLLRVFNQVMVRVEPKLSGIDKDLLQLREQIAMDKEHIATVSAEFESYMQRIQITEVQIKEKDTQFARLHRCHLCLAENLTPRSREKFVKRTTTKRFSSANTKAEVQEEQSPEELFQASLTAQESHTTEEGANNLGLEQTEGEKTEEIKGSPGIEGDAKGGEENMHEIVALPGEIIPGTAGLESTKKISQAFQHKDGLHRDMPVQTLEDNTRKHPFSEILQRPATAPPRMDTSGMEIFAPLTEEENIIFQKQKLERKLARELEEASDDGEELAGTDQEFKNLAANTIELLERSHFDLGLASKIRVLLSRLRQLKKVGVQGAVVDDEEQDPSGEGSEMAVDGEDSSVASKKKGKKGWGKVKKGLDPARRRSSQLEDLMSRSRRGSSIKPYGDICLTFMC